MVVLIDMDNVIADLDKGFLDWYYSNHPDEPRTSPAERTTFYLDQQFDQSKVFDIIFSKGFFLSLEPVQDAIESVKELGKISDVFICTSPCSDYQYCLRDKMEWIERYFGKDWLRTVIFTHDKTVVKGDFLIDDKPEVSGRSKPQWQHLLFDAPYNKHILDKKRMDWSNWKDTMGLFGLHG